MKIAQLIRSCGILLALFVFTVIPTSTAFGQLGGGGFGGGGGGFGGGGLGGGGLGGGGGNQDSAGVIVDADGVLRMKLYRDPRGTLQKQRFLAARAALNPQLAKPSQMRKISLTRLEQAISKRLEANEPITNEMKYLAGLLRLQYVFYYPETNDIVIAGPAEGFAEDLAGRARGLSTGRAVIELQDLITALRAFAPGQEPTRLVGCSIDPTQEGLQRMQQFLARVGRQITPNQTAQIVRGLKQSLGKQIVTINGVSPKSHFAQVLVEADYRMKLIGIGLERPPVKMKSYVERTNPSAVSRNALSRWYFVPDYKAVRMSDDEMAMELVGWGVKLVGAEELVTRGGNLEASGRGNRASRSWCSEFTEKYPSIADREPVYAQLRNLIDLSVAAAFMQKKQLFSQANWDLGVFADEQKLPVEIYEVPRQVESAINAIWRGNSLMTPIGGGVELEPLQALKTSNLIPENKQEVTKARQSVKVDQLKEGQWWWD